MNAKDKERVQRANGNGAENGKQEKRSHQNAQAGANTIQDKLNQARNGIKKGAKSYILAGINDALEEIASGDFGEFGDEVFEGFDKLSESLNQSSKELIDERILPKSLPQSEAESEMIYTVDVAAN